ncbi:fructosamine kinase family protein [Virgibacillus xinjiangensis]|uniref:Fructosamine kinase family protein n=1 Tax=Virgibacillus xinjiangensis TaxID=393090 RepID=A0ABV7CYS1_9BACI
MDKRLAGQALYHAGDRSPIHVIQPVQGGSINRSFYLETDEGRYFLKSHPSSPEGFFHAEAQGLQVIRETNTIQVPEVFTYADQPGEAFILLEWIEGNASEQTERLLGKGIAEMHQSHTRLHGFHDHTFIGLLPQQNGLYENWVDYYKRSKLYTQYELGVQSGKISGRRRERMEKLMAEMERWIPLEVQASCLHGDLWGGNWITGPDGAPFVIDPSVLYGDRHFDLAFTEVFGGFSSDFYRAYEEVFPIEDYYHDIKPLYQLYYLLVHLNLFGDSYGSSVDTVLKRYTG